MLVITRNKDEVIVAGNYRITVVEIGEDVVKLRLERQLWKTKARRLCEFWAAVDEPFAIGEAHEDIVGKVTEIKGDRVRIGVAADRDKVPVDRLELHVVKTGHSSPKATGRRHLRLGPPEISPPPRRRHSLAHPAQ